MELNKYLFWNETWKKATQNLKLGQRLTFHPDFDIKNPTSTVKRFRSDLDQIILIVLECPSQSSEFFVVVVNQDVSGLKTVFSLSL